MSTETELESIARVLRDDPRFSAAIVFGSVARDRARPDSDLDLAVLYADAAARGSVDRELSVIAMDLQQAVQACIDLAVHACADGGHGLPTGPADAFSRLARAGLIDQALATRLAGAAGLRNLIVRRYGDLDCARLAALVRHDLGDLEVFVAAMRNA